IARIRSDGIFGNDTADDGNAWRARHSSRAICGGLTQDSGNGAPSKVQNAWRFTRSPRRRGRVWLPEHRCARTIVQEVHGEKHLTHLLAARLALPASAGVAPGL